MKSPMQNISVREGSSSDDLSKGSLDSNNTKSLLASPVGRRRSLESRDMDSKSTDLLAGNRRRSLDNRGGIDNDAFLLSPKRSSLQGLPPRRRSQNNSLDVKRLSTHGSSHSASSDDLFDSLHSLHTRSSIASSLNGSFSQREDDDEFESDFDASFASMASDDGGEEELLELQRKRMEEVVLEEVLSPKRAFLMKARKLGRGISALDLIAE